MRTNREIRGEAWRLLRKTPWGWRVLCTGMLVGVGASLVMNALAIGLEGTGVQTWSDFAVAAARARWSSGIELAIPSLRVAAYMTVATAFVAFIKSVFLGIQTFAMNSATLCAVTEEKSESWFRAALAGFGRPFGMFGLMFFWSLRVTWWIYLGALVGFGAWIRGGSSPAILAVAAVAAVAGISLSVIAAYRYRFAWFVKVRHPDWGANRCLNETRRLMEGRKWASFLLDCSYWKPIAVWLTGLLVFTVLFVGLQLFEQLFAVFGLLMFLAFLFLVGFGLYLTLYLNFGQAVFYRELLATEAA